MPDLSKMPGEPKAPAETTTSLLAFAVITGRPTSLVAYSIPIARLPLPFSLREFIRTRQLLFHLTQR